MIIQTTTADKLAAITAPAGSYPCVVSKITSKKSQSEKSYNHRTIFVVADGKYKGKEFEVVFNGAMKNASFFNGQMMFPEYETVRLRAAIENVKIDDIPEGDFDLESLIGKGILLAVDIEQVNGLYVNKVTNFLPLAADQAKGWNA